MPSEISGSPAFMNIQSSQFTIEIDYSKVQNLPIGECIFSPTFTADGYDWALCCYPQGEVEDLEKKGLYMSLYLCLKSEATDITTQFSFQLRGKMGNYVTIYKVNEATFISHDRCLGARNVISREETEMYLSENGILAILCKIRVLTKQKIVQNYPGGLCEHIEQLWEKGEGFDVTFNVEGESISAHRLILAARSPVFHADLFNPKATTKVKAKIKPIKIDEMKADVFKAFLHFIYTDKLPTDGSSDDGTPSVELLQGLFVAADRYDLGKLNLMCVELLEKNLSVNTVSKTLLLADRHSHGSGLKHKCLKFASNPKNFIHVVHTDEYLEINKISPTLFAELRDLIKKSSTRVAKAQRSG